MIFFLPKVASPETGQKGIYVMFTNVDFAAPQDHPGHRPLN